MNIINVEFDKTLIALSGNEFGHLTYVVQIKDKLKIGERNIIVFSDNIQIIGISFVKGLFSELLKDYNVTEIKKIIGIKCCTKGVEDSVWDSLNF